MNQYSYSRRKFIKNTILTSGAGLLGSELLQADPSPSLSGSPPDSPVNDSPVIDANVGLGRFASGLNPDLAQTDKTLQHLGSAGINKALVYSVLARETDSEEGNSLVLEECVKHSGLIPSFVISPYEMDIDTVLSLMDRHDISVARLYPEKGYFSVYPSIIGPIVEKLQNAGKVLFIDFESLVWSGKVIDYNAIYQLCRSYPKIPVVLIGSTILGSRNYPNLLKECDNLFLEISQIFQPEGIFRLVQQGYGKRLIFGSGFPRREPGALLNMLAYSGIAQEELQNICYGNLLRLLDIKYDNNSFSLKTPEKREIIDLHIHQGAMSYLAPSGAGTADDIIRNMDRCGIKAVMTTSSWSTRGEIKRGNKAVSEACAKYPGRIFGYITLDPKYPEEVESELKLYGENPSFRGIKQHLESHQVDINDSRNEIIYSFADKKGWPLLIHDRYFYFPDGVNPDEWEKVCTTYRNAKFIMAHTGGMDPRFEKPVFKLAELARKHKNLYFDCAASHIFPGALDRLAAVAGAEQIVYGSDYPMFDFAFETGRVFSSSLNEEEKNLILHGNAKKLIGL